MGRFQTGLVIPIRPSFVTSTLLNAFFINKILGIVVKKLKKKCSFISVTYSFSLLF